MALVIDNQNNKLTVGTDGSVTFDEHSSSPATPALGNVVLYAKADGLLYSKDDAGAESSLSGGGGTPGGADTQVQFNDSSTFGGDVDLTWNKTTNTLAIAGVISNANGTAALPSYTFTSDLTYGQQLVVTLQ